MFFYYFVTSDKHIDYGHNKINTDMTARQSR